MANGQRPRGGPGSNQHGPKGVSKQQPKPAGRAFASGVGDGGATTDPLDVGDATSGQLRNLRSQLLSDADRYGMQVRSGSGPGEVAATLRDGTVVRAVESEPGFVAVTSLSPSGVVLWKADLAHAPGHVLHDMFLSAAENAE